MPSTRQIRRVAALPAASTLGAASAVALAVVLSASLPPAAAAAPPIRTSAANAVPRCVTPERLMAFLETRNQALLPRFRAIAETYRRHGEAWRVRWDYAFFQMALETNFLTFRRPNGSFGDVRERQNNFAGLGTTGGGVPGDSYPDVATGVLAQIQHLVVYSGERVAAPVGARTRLKQDDILAASAAVVGRRPLTFQDLSGRWAADRKYGRSINHLAGLFAERYCSGLDITRAHPAERGHAVASRPAATSVPALQVRPAQTPVPKQALRVAPPVANPPTASPSSCRVTVASYGGNRTLLIRADDPGGRTEITALDVHAGFEASMAESFIKRYAPGGRSIGAFDSRTAALGHAYRICPQPAAAARSG